MTKLDWSVFERTSGNISLGRAAYLYAEAGFQVIAAEPRGKGSIYFDPVSFCPIPQDPARWDTWPHANVGLLTGDDFWVLDVDGERGLESLAWLRDVLHDDLDTLTVRTGKGLHLYFELPPLAWTSIPNAISVLPGIDVRGRFGQVIAPPSAHSSGARYEIAGYPERPVLALPGLLRLVMNAEGVILRPFPLGAEPESTSGFFEPVLVPAAEYWDAEKAIRRQRGPSTKTPSNPI